MKLEVKEEGGGEGGRVCVCVCVWKCVWERVRERVSECIVCMSGSGRGLPAPPVQHDTTVDR